MLNCYKIFYTTINYSYLLIHSFLQHLVMPNTLMSMSLGNDFRIILICNAYSTNQEYFSRPMNILTETLNGNAKTAAGGQVPPAPFSMVVLDSLTVHSKMSLIHRYRELCAIYALHVSYKNLHFNFVAFSRK